MMIMYNHPLVETIPPTKFQPNQLTGLEDIVPVPVPVSEPALALT